MPLQYTRSKPSSTQEGAAGDAPAVSNESLRQKAKFRLLGSMVLVLLGVLGFTLMLDTQPRPNTAEVTVLIPARDKLPPLAMTTPSATAASGTLPVIASATPASAPASHQGASGNSTVAASTSLEPQEVIVSKPARVKPAASASSAAAKEEPKVATPVKKAEATPSPVAATASDGDKGRYILQVGAFADVQKAREARMKLEHAGLKTYTQVIETSEGKRIRVRVGPFEKRTEAEKVAAKIKMLDLPAALLTL